MANRIEDVKLPRASKGKRSQFYQDPAIDQMMAGFIGMMAEMAALRERLDTVERLLEDKAGIARQDIEDYLPGPAVEAERSAWNQGFIRRVMRLSETPDT